jgi:hypothetical protein
MNEEQRKLLESLIVEYLATLDDSTKEEQFETDRTYARWELTEFFEWLEKRCQHNTITHETT